MSQPSTSKDKPDDVEMTKASQEGIRENTLHFRDYLSGTSGVTVIGLLAASSIIPLLTGGFSIPAITMWLSAIGGNALAGWMTTWAEKAAAKGILKDKDQRDEQLVQLATDLQQHFDQNNTESKELQDSIVELLNKVSAMQIVLEANDNEYILEQLESKSRRDDLIKGKLHRLVMKELQSIHSITSENRQNILKILDQSSSKSNTTQIQEAHQLLETLPLDVVPEVAPLPEPHRMPLIQNRLFVGREQNLLEIANALKHGQTTVIAAATGIGGIGKTQLASEFVHRYGQYFAGGIFWLSFADTNTIPNEIADCGGKGAMNLPYFANLKLTQQTEQVMREWSRPIPRLLIFDNCEETDVLDKYLPRTGGCRVLVTSRRANWQADLGMQTLSIVEFSVDEGIELLRKFRPDLSSDNVYLIEIVKDLGGLPLAIHLAGSYLKVFKDDLRPEEYLAELRSQNSLEHESLQGADVTVSPTKHELHVGRTFALSYDRLNPDNNIDNCALTLLKHAACFAPGVPIARNLLLRTLEQRYKAAERLASRALNRLVDFGLLERTETGALRLHRLIAKFTENVMEHIEYEEAQSKVRHIIYQDIYDQNDLPTKSDDVLLQHVSFLIDTATKDDKSVAYLCNELGYSLIRSSNYDQARIYLERAQKMYEVGLESDKLYVLILTNLGTLHERQANYNIANTYLENALYLSRSFFGEKSKQTIGILTNLATVSLSKVSFIDAQLYIDMALKLSKEIFDINNPQIATVLFALGAFYEDQGDYNKALDNYRQSLTIRESTLGETHPETAQSLNNLGLLLTTLRKFSEAKIYLDRAFSINVQLFGEYHYEAVHNINNIGHWFQEQGQFVESQPFLENALIIARKILEEYHPLTATILNNLGNTLQFQGDYAGALNLFYQALEIDETVYGSNHPQTAVDLLNIGGILEAQQKYREAKETYERALYIQKQKTPQHLHTALTKTKLASLHRQLDHPQKAIEFYESALGLCVSILEENDHRVIGIQIELAELLFNEGRYKEAEMYFRKVLSILDEVLDQDICTHILTRLFFCVYYRGNLPNAIHYGEKCLIIMERKFGIRHLDTAMCVYSLGSIYYEMGILDRAKERLQQALDLMSDIDPYNLHLNIIKKMLSEINFYHSRSRSR